jgi:hypothetical protein
VYQESIITKQTLARQHSERRARIAAKAVKDDGASHPVGATGTKESILPPVRRPPTFKQFFQSAAQKHPDLRIPAPTYPHVSLIQKIVAQEYGVGIKDICAECNRAAVVRPRHVAMFLAKTLTPLSLPEIGRRFSRDHTSVLHAVRKIERQIALDSGLAETVAALRDLVQQRIGSPNSTIAG